MSPRPDYGLDAPGWLAGASAAGVILVGVGVYFRVAVTDGQVVGYAIWPGIVLLTYAAGHLWSSKVGKRIRARRMLDTIDWTGDEHVLDVGCGRGLLLIEAAKRLSAGRAIGVDIWRSKDQWDNRPEATLRNAELEGVSDRVEVRDADARSLPFGDESFDVVVSSFVIHNIRPREDRIRAVREMVRVLRPSGQLILTDIEGTRRYEGELRASGLADVRRELTSPLFVPGTATVFARNP